MTHTQSVCIVQSDSDSDATTPSWSPCAKPTPFQPLRATKSSRPLDANFDSDFTLSQTSYTSSQALPCTTKSDSSAASSTSSSPGFEIIEVEGQPKGPKRWEAASWPPHVERLHAHKESTWKFPSVAVGRYCGCKLNCTAETCKNAKNNRFCCRFNCIFAGMCDNALQEGKSIAICKSSHRGGLGLVATRAKGNIIGEYFGSIELFGPPCANGPPNNGYRMHLKTLSTNNKHLDIDASEVGGLFRLANHSCNPSARFHEIQTGRHLTVAVVTIRDVYPGDEITVSYGDALWFICRCGWEGCQHRDIQHLCDP